jgi:hypothetical protein
MPLFIWTDGPGWTSAADDAWYVAEVYAAAVEREAEKAAKDATP